jgi:hypothetical protein
MVVFMLENHRTEITGTAMALQPLMYQRPIFVVILHLHPGIAERISPKAGDRQATVPLKTNGLVGITDYSGVYHYYYGGAGKVESHK